VSLWVTHCFCYMLQAKSCSLYYAAFGYMSACSSLSYLNVPYHGILILLAFVWLPQSTPKEGLSTHKGKFCSLVIQDNQRDCTVQHSLSVNVESPPPRNEEVTQTSITDPETLNISSQPYLSYKKVAVYKTIIAVYATIFQTYS
jgi:hypothetical protein